jgi:recombination protein RecR
MSEGLPESARRLVRVFAKLPGVGQRTAMRYVLSLLREGEPRLSELAEALREAAATTRLCPACFALAATDRERCDVCLDPSRNGSELCVVEGLADQLALESTGLFRGRYFVLHRLLSPLKGIGPAELHVDVLARRVREEGIAEVLIATSLTADGETTATFLRKVLAAAGVRVSRLAAGVPVGGSIEYLDRQTLTRAIQDRKDM